MKILIAPDKFKGCLSGAEAAALIAEGVRLADPRHTVELRPIADGGEGTAETVRLAAGGVWREVSVHDARGREMTARYAWLEQTRTAVLDMSAAAGLAALPATDRDPWQASTFGVGELMRAAIENGATRIIVGLGGSATNDAGAGMASALGWRFAPYDGRPAEFGPAHFSALNALRAPKFFPAVEIIGACDVTNPLLGPRGATRVFAPQKGATTPADLARLETALECLADLAATTLGRDERDTPGAGAAGGLGYGLLMFAGARLTSGFDLVAEVIGLEHAIMAADLVITGEGSLDAQTLDGKGPAGVAALARRHGKPVIALGGRVRKQARDAGVFDHCFELAGDEVPIEQALREAAPRLRVAAREAALAAAYSSI